jgi:serine/threonine protein kinase
MSDVMNQPTIDLDQARFAPRAPALDPVPSVAVGQVLRGRYVLEARLGTGGKGTVFKALDRFRAALPSTHQYVALKVLDARGDCSAQRLADLRQEFYCGQGLSHRNVVNVHELDCDGDVVFFTMELLDGEPLSEVIERLGAAPMQRSQAWQLIQQLGAGLAHAHQRGVVHGDLKPQNIFITHEGELRILDFGAARIALDSQSQQAGFARNRGTPAYASCEQLEGRAAESRDDLYALACVCYELLEGTHPFQRRAATLARDYRVSAIRPHGLTGRQWRTLQKGLSWHRAGRGISVHLWMLRLMNDRAQDHSLTPLRELAQSKAVPSSLPWRLAALSFVAAILSIAAVVTQPRPTASPRTTAAASPVPSAAVNPELAASQPSPTTPDVDTPASVSKKPYVDEALKSKATRSTPYLIAVDAPQVRSDDHFVEIRLQRSLLQKPNSFTWWTEAGTAKPDIDYVSEKVATQNFPTGYRATRLYVRLLPRALRSQRAFFYIAVSQPGHEGRPTVIRQQIWLPPSSSLQAQR